MDMYLKDQQKRRKWIMAKGNTHWQRPKNKTTKQNTYIKQQNQTVCYCNKGQGKCVDEYMYIFQFFSQLHVINNNRIQRRYSRFFTISSQRCELTPTRTLKWPRRNRVQITCNISSAYHMQHVVLHATWYEGKAQLLSVTELKSHVFELYFVGWIIKPMKVSAWIGWPGVSVLWLGEVANLSAISLSEQQKGK